MFLLNEYMKSQVEQIIQFTIQNVSIKSVLAGDLVKL